MTLDGFLLGLEKFQAKLTGKIPQALLKRIAKFGEEQAKEYLNQSGHVDSGTTLDSIHGYVDGNKVIIEAGGNAVWLEFGTGITYNPNGYPVAVEGIVGHGEYGEGHGADISGWVFDTPDERLAIKDKNGEPIKFDDGNYLAHTYGIEAVMFMYRTMEDIIAKAPEWGIEIIKSELTL